MCDSLSTFYPVMQSLYIFLSVYNNMQTYFACNTSIQLKWQQEEIFRTRLFSRVSHWSRDPLAEIVLSSDDIGQGEQPQ